MRRCPRCGDFYADEALAFCLADGEPLVRVHPNSDPWREGARVVERKERALRRQTRRLRWRRVLMTTTTVLITAVVISVVAVNAVIYLRPERDEVAATPTPSPDEPTPSPTLDPTPTPDETPTPTPTPSPSPSPTATPTPTPVYQISGRVLGVEMFWREVRVALGGGGRPASAAVDAEGRYSFKNLPAGRSYTVTPSGPTLEFSPPLRTFNNLSRDESADFSGRHRRKPTPTPTPTPTRDSTPTLTLPHNRTPTRPRPRPSPDGVTSRPRGAL